MIEKKIYYIWMGDKEKPEIFHKCTYTLYLELHPAQTKVGGFTLAEKKL